MFFDHVTHQSRFCFVSLLEISNFQVFEGIFCRALIASFWPALSIVSNEIENKVTNKFQHEISFEIEDSAAEFRKNIVTKLDNGAPKGGGMRSSRLTGQACRHPSSAVSDRLHSQKRCGSSYLFIELRHQ